MNKTIKSEVRKLLFCMISKYEEKKLVKQAVLREKQDCLRTVTEFFRLVRSKCLDIFLF